MGDRIVYLVTTTPGGEDGRDPTDKEGKILLATFQKDAAITFKGQDPNKHVKATVVDVSVVRQRVKDNLTAVERLVIFPEDDAPVKRTAAPPRKP